MKSNAMSLKSKIITQFVIIILPMLLVLIYQTISNDRSAAELQRINSLYEQIQNAKAKYKIFNNGVVDAVDSGAVSKSAIGALDEAKSLILNLQKSDPSKNFNDLVSPLESVYKSISADPSITAILPLRETINQLDKKLGESVSSYADANRQTVAQTITSAERIKLIVSFATLFTLVTTVYFVLRMIRGLTEPLTEAEQLANRIAIGEIKSNCEVAHAGDLGILMTSLCAMNNSLYKTISRVKEAAGTVSKASTSLSSSTDEVLSAVQRQLSAVSQTRADIEIMNDSIRHVSERTSVAQQVADKTQEVANTGSSNMAKSLSATEQIVAAVEATAGKINHLTNSVQKINEFTQIIREIAEQTNLLALNAAIEAARAGEQGRGFAVVADEVRKLAERTSAGTAEIAGIVTTIHAQTDEAVQSMNQVKEEVAKGAGYSRTTNEILQQIVSSAHESAEQSKQNAAAAVEQMAAANKAVDNTQRIATITDENNAHIQQMHQAADNLIGTATELQQLIEQFKLV